MKTILSSRRYNYVARVSIFLIAIALIAGMLGCVDYNFDYPPGESPGAEDLPEWLFPQVGMIIHSTEGGSVTTPGEGLYTCVLGTVVDLVAEPEAGYHFVHWTGDVGTIADVNDATTTITMNDDYFINANFKRGGDFPRPQP